MKYLKLTKTKLQPLLMTYLPDLIIVTVFSKNLILLFQLCVNGQNDPLSEVSYWIPLDLFKDKIWISNPISCPLHVAFVKKCISNLGFINQIWFFIVAYDLVDIKFDSHHNLRHIFLYWFQWRCSETQGWMIFHVSYECNQNETQF